MKFQVKSIIGTVIATTMLSSFLSTWYIIDESERGVLLRNGAFKSVEEPGLHFKVPFIDTTKIISIANQAALYEGVQAYSKDQQNATMNVSVSWHVDPTRVSELYTQYRDLDGVLNRLISRNVGTQTENVFGQYSAASAVQQRVQLVNDLNNAIRQSATGPIVIDSVQIENIDFSDAYEKAIADRMEAEVKVETRRQLLATEEIQANIVITKAKAEAEAQLAQAVAAAKAVELNGKAEAEAIRAKSEALKDNAGLVDLIKAERWNGSLPQTMLPNTAIPFIGK